MPAKLEIEYVPIDKLKPFVDRPKGDGVTDDTEAIVHTLERGNGTLQVTRGNYLITRTVPIVACE